MKIKLLGFIGASFLATGVFAQATNYDVGDVVADFTVTDTDGNEHSLYEITASGKHVYIDFFFDTCPPCQATSPIFGEFYDKYGCNSGDVYCLVMNNGTDDDAAVEAYEESYGGPGHHAPAVSSEGGGGAVTTDFGVGAFPTYILIGPDNKLIEQDIYPIADITTFEGTFYDGFDPDPMPCSFAGVEDIVLDQLSIYPNPTNDFTTIQFSSENEAEATITIYNMLGEVVEANNIHVVSGNNVQELNLENYQTGSYIVQIQLGEAIITSKIEVIN